MSLINEALKRADGIGQDGQTPPAYRTGRPAKRSMHGIEHLYDDKAPASEAASEEEISRLLSKNQTSLRGAAALGACVIAAVAVIMHLTLPPDQRGPVEAEAGGATATFETQTPPTDEKIKTTPAKASEKSSMAALQRALAGVLNRNADQTPETTPPPEPAAAVRPAPDKQKPDDQQTIGQFKLSGILASGGRGYAIVNGHMVTVGDNIDGARVVTIGKHHVVLEKDGKRLVLRM